MKEAQHRKIILPGKIVTYSSMYRLLLAEGLLQNIPGDPQDRRRFESEDPNDLWQSDIMHGPYLTVENKQRKTYLLFFLDDMSRLICHGEFYLHERLSCFLDSFRQALLKRGIPRKLYGTKEHLKRLYVAMTRPRYMLCLALLKDHLGPNEKAGREMAGRLSAKGWELLDLTDRIQEEIA